MNLITALKNNDESAFKKVYQLYKEKVLNYFLKKTASLPDAEDLLQNTFLRLWRYRASLCEDYLLDQHLFHMAKTVFIDFTREQNKVKRIAATLITEKEAVASDALLDKERVRQILAEMPEIRKQAFIMHKIEGYSYKEIATALSVSVKSVDNHVSRALKQMRKAFCSFFWIFIFFLMK